MVSFVVAVMALIPLRFVEAGQTTMDQPQVLGVQSEIVLPTAEVKAAPVLEAPYNEIENSAGCISAKEAAKMIATLKKSLVTGDVDKEQAERLLGRMESIQANTCKY